MLSQQAACQPRLSSATWQAEFWQLPVLGHTKLRRAPCKTPPEKTLQNRDVYHWSPPTSFWAVTAALCGAELNRGQSQETLQETSCAVALHTSGVKMLRLMGLGYLLLFRGSSRRPDMAVMGTPDTQTGNLLLAVKEMQSQREGRGCTIGVLNRKGKKKKKSLADIFKCF